jgi:hypothetical protein
MDGWTGGRDGARIESNEQLRDWWMDEGKDASSREI